MKPCTRMGIAVFAVLVAFTPLQAANAGPGGGGGHGGGGRHGGGHGFSGHPSGSSSGRGVGHAIGHSFGHLVGHHDKAPATSSEHGTSPFIPSRFIGSAPVHDNVGQHTRSQFLFASDMRHRFPHRRFNHFPFGHRFPGAGFGFNNCDRFGFHPFGVNNFNCFGGGFFFDPFFFDPFFIGGGTAFVGGGPAFVPFADQNLAYVPADSSTPPPPDMGAPAEPPCDSAAPTSSVAGNPNPANCQRPVTLLQLRDGSMYGLTDYWVENAELHYTTTYGGQNSVPFDRIDFDKTVKLNADRGVPFVLRPKSQ